MTYAVRTRLAVAEMPLPEGNLLGPRKRRKPIPSRGCYFMIANTVRWSASQLWQPLDAAYPCAGPSTLQVVHCFPELSTESLHGPVTRLTPGLDAELSCALGDRDRGPMESLTKLSRCRSLLAAKHTLDLPHLLTLGHHTTHRSLSVIPPYVLWPTQDHHQRDYDPG